MSTDSKTIPPAIFQKWVGDNKRNMAYYYGQRWSSVYHAGYELDVANLMIILVQIFM